MLMVHGRGARWQQSACANAIPGIREDLTRFLKNHPNVLLQPLAVAAIPEFLIIF